MKRKIAIWSLLALAGTALTFASCEDTPPAKPVAVFEVSDAPLTFPAEEPAAKEVAVKAENVEWSVDRGSADYTWLTVEKSEGKIVVSVDANETAETRSGSVVVTPDSDKFEPVTIEGSQTAKDVRFEVSDDPLAFVADSPASQEVMVEAVLVEWSVEIVNAPFDWLSVEKGDGKFTVTAITNDTYAVREANIIVTPDNDAIEAVTIAVSQEAKAREQIELPTPANSHIVAPGGSVYLAVDRAFDIWKDYLETDLTGDISAQLVWETTIGLIAGAELVEGYFGNEAVIKVDVAAAKTGNAAVGVKIGDDICWTWHIWVPEGTVGEVTSTSSDTKFMDRNLGAIKAGIGGTNTADLSQKTWGMYYQWGRPQPLVWADQKELTAPSGGALWEWLPIYDADGTEISYKESRLNGDGSLATAIKNPATYLGSWNGAGGNDSWLKEGGKTLLDPCPAGWRVPLSTTWAAADYDSSTKKVSGSNIRGAKLNGSFFPAAGHYKYETTLEGEVMPSSAGTYWNYWFAERSVVEEVAGNPLSLYLAGLGNADFAKTTYAPSVAMQIRCVEE